MPFLLFRHYGETHASVFMQYGACPEVFQRNAVQQSQPSHLHYNGKIAKATSLLLKSLFAWNVFVYNSVGLVSREHVEWVARSVAYIRKVVMKHLREMCAVLVLMAAGCAAAYSQAVSGTVLGTVTDSSGGVVPSAKVTLTEVNTGIVHNGQTNGSGNYTFPDLPEGNYSVTVEAPGFKKETKQNNRVEVNSSVRVDAVLQPGQLSESVVVTAEPPQLQTDRADTGRNIDSMVGVATAGSGQQPQLSSPAGPGARHVAADGGALPVL